MIDRSSNWRGERKIIMKKLYAVVTLAAEEDW
jgi:hypothetical protein